MTIGKIIVKVGARKYCLWPMAILTVLRIPVPKWMFAVEEVK